MPAMPYVVNLLPRAVSDRGYDLRLGPLWFVCPIEPVQESIGDGLEVVGAAIAPAERRPRPLTLTLPVRAGRQDVDPTATGLRMRREVRALIDNARWRLGGLYLTFGADPDLEGWYLVGGADLDETNAGVTFGDFRLDLTDVYLVGRPGTHKPARRLDLGDRRTGTVRVDTRGFIYTTDAVGYALPARPLILPGDTLLPLGAGLRTPSSIQGGPVYDGRRLWREVAAVDGEVVSYLPDDAVTGYADLDDPGAVRVWNLAGGSVVYPPTIANYSAQRAADPTLDGWERVYGDVIQPTTRLAVDNGACRVIWLGPGPGSGLALETRDPSTGAYRRIARALHGLNVREARVLEVTTERAVVEFRGGARAMRVVLQRGWYGPRIESYNDDGGAARIEIAGTDFNAAVGAAQIPSWVDRINVGTDYLLGARQTSTDALDTTPQFIAAPAAVCLSRTRALVWHLDLNGQHTSTGLASLSIVDAQAIPTLVER